MSVTSSEPIGWKQGPARRGALEKKSEADYRRSTSGRPPAADGIRARWWVTAGSSSAPAKEGTWNSASWDTAG